MMKDTLDEIAYFFDDFFVPEDDPGHEVTVKIRGREVPIFVKRGLSLADREAAKAKAVQTRVNPKNGQLEVVGVDEGVFQVELLLRAIVSWPFEYRDGRPVAITRENINMMLPDCADTLVQHVMSTMRKEKESLDFFESKSEEAS